MIMGEPMRGRNGEGDFWWVGVAWFSRRLARRKPFHLNAIGPLLDFPQVILHLQSEPCFRRAAEGFGESHRHFRRYAAVAVEQFGQRLAGHAQPLRRCRDRQPQGREAFFADDFAGVGGGVCMTRYSSKANQKTLQLS